MNVLDALPKKEQLAVKEVLRQIVSAESQAECEKRRDGNRFTLAELSLHGLALS
jgi:ribosomal protein L13E